MLFFFEIRLVFFVYGDLANELLFKFMPVNWKELINGSNFGSRDSLLTIEGVYLRIRTGSTL
jgi:hypothetical protein